MKITVPHFGNTHVAVKALFDGLGIDCIIPEQSNNMTLEAGSKYSPEEICLPFKIMLGNILKGIEAGADTVILPGSCGPCRFGEYCELKMQILKLSGYDVDFVVIDKPTEIGEKELIKRINFISSKSEVSRAVKLKKLIEAYRILKQTDRLEGKFRYLSGFEINKGEFKYNLSNFKQEISELASGKDMINCIKKYNRIADKLEIDNNKQPIKISIVGEIYTIIEAYSNYYIEDILMDYGISTNRTLTPSWWVKDMLLSPFKINSVAINKAGKEYLPIGIGGHAIECVGEASVSARNGVDGIIQIFPLGCMPEIVSKVLLKEVSKDKNIPILSLMVDGLGGEAGFITRVEAFVDILERRRECIH